MEEREMRALHIAATTQLRPGDDGRWNVPSQSGAGAYTVLATREHGWSCTCPDHEERLLDCKHIRAVVITVRRESSSKGETFTKVTRKTYRQDWPAYNAAQTDEKRMFRVLLADLCRLVPQPPQQIGGPRLSYADMTFALVYKAYERLSSRRFTTDLRDAQANGMIDRVPHFNSVLGYMRDEDLSVILRELVALSSLPLRSIETQFAIDSSGFGVSRMRTWFSQKHGQEMREREWVKAHLVCGTSTHTVTAVAVSPAAANDGPYLPDLVTRTALNFPGLRDVSADKGYSSKANADLIERLGANPFIAFKGNTVRPAEGTAWARMYHFYSYNREEFLRRYHRRSNVESCFRMVKSKFGDTLFSRTETAQTNEVLSKVLAHNLCVLVQSFYELGIEPEFIGAIDLSAIGALA